MRVVHIAAAVAAATVLLAGCGEGRTSSGAGSDAPTASATSSEATAEAAPSPEWTGDVIPDGTYTKTATRADAERLGLPNDVLGENGKARYELAIAGGTWVQFGEEGRAMVVGDEGTATYDAEGDWVTTSNSYGCPGCVATIAWKFKDGRLTLKLVDGQGTGDPVDVLISRLVMEGEWALK